MKICLKHGWRMRRLPTPPEMDYDDKYMWVCQFPGSACFIRESEMQEFRTHNEVTTGAEFAVQFASLMLVIALGVLLLQWGC